MIILRGLGIVKGIVFGQLLIQSAEFNIVKELAQNVDDEIAKFNFAKNTAKNELEKLYANSVEKIGKEQAEIFNVHKLMLEDKNFNDAAVKKITKNLVSAKYAIYKVAKSFSKSFANLNDPYMTARSVDIIDIAKRLVGCLNEKKVKSAAENEYEKNFILFAEDFTPSEIIELDKEKIKGILLYKGNENSHMAILAKALNIPTVLKLNKKVKQNFGSANVILDGISGVAYIEPDEITVSRLKNQLEVYKHRTEYLKLLKGKENITKDGQKIKLYANINSIDEVNDAILNDAGGIGLFRTEFLFLNRSAPPDEEEQFKAYKKVIKKMKNKPVIFRTVDIGADKKTEYFKFEAEENPAMGYRGIRLCLDKIKFFKMQLRAIYRASAFGNALIMFPLIVSADEIIAAKKIIKKVKKELDEEKIIYSKFVKIGIMVETPAAVLISDELAKIVDFFSIGTNDLTQYTLAMDRQNNKINNMYNPYHKSILKMIKIVVNNAHKNKIWVGICGELASDEVLTKMFLSLGVDELSMQSSFILGIRKTVMETNVANVKDEILQEIQ